MLKFFWPLLTLNYYSQSFHILRQKMIISQVFLQQQQQQNTPHFIVYFSENQKIKKHKQKSSPRDKDEWCFDHKTLYLEKKQKTKTIFWTVAAAPNYIMTSWKKKWLTNESFSKSVFSSLCKSFTQSDSQNKTKIKPPLPPLPIEWMCSRRKVIVSDTSFERTFLFFVSFCNFFWNTIKKIWET